MATPVTELEIISSGFEQIHFSNTPSIKINSLFNLVEVLTVENHALVRDYKLHDAKNIIVNENRIAYLFKFKDVPHVYLYPKEKYNFIERHVTIDKFYAENNSLEHKKGLSAAHYTENYQELHTNAKITVHVYFTGQGGYYSQIKKTNSGGTTTELPITSILENNIKNNIHDALALLKGIIKEKSERHLKAVETADKYEQQLALFSQNFSASDNRTQYKHLATQFQEQVDFINLYNDTENDLRAKIVQNILKKLENFEKQTPPRLEISVSEEVKEEENLIIKSPLLPNKKEVDPLDTLLAEIAALEKNLKTYLDGDIKNTIQAHHLASQLRDKLLELTFFPGLTLTQQAVYQEKIKNIEKDISTLPSLSQLFIDAVKKGDAETVKLLFPHISNADQVAVSKILFTHLASENEVPHEGKMDICNFLFEKSSAYRSHIVLYDGKLLKAATSIGKAYSFLFEIFFQGKIKVFEMLLKHGFDPNGPGLISGNQITSILKSVLCNQGDVEYVKLLLQYGASIDRPSYTINADCIEKIQAINSATPINISQVFQKTQNSDDAITILESPSDLWLACRYGRYECIPPLLERSDLFGITLALCSVATLKEYNIRTLYSAAVPGVYCCTTKAETQEIANNEQSIAHLLQKNTQDQIKFMICPIRNATDAFPSIQILCQAFKKRYEAESENISRLLERLNTYTSNAYLKNPQAIKTTNFYKAYQFLLCEKKRKLTFEETAKLIEISCKIGNFYLAFNTVETREEAKANFTHAIGCAKASSFQAELAKLEIYKFAEKKLKEIENRVNSSSTLLTQYTTTHSSTTSQAQTIQIQQSTSVSKQTQKSK